MSSDKTTNGTATTNPSWNLDLLFSMLSDPFRRGIIVSLGRKGPQTAAELAPPGPGGNFLTVRLNRVVKCLTNMRESGFVVVLPHPTDGRKQLYSLAPGIIATKTEKGCHFEFGVCLLRL